MKTAGVIKSVGPASEIKNRVSNLRTRLSGYNLRDGKGVKQGALAIRTTNSFITLSLTGFKYLHTHITKRVGWTRRTYACASCVDP